MAASSDYTPNSPTPSSLSVKISPNYKCRSCLGKGIVGGHYAGDSMDWAASVTGANKRWIPEEICGTCGGNGHTTPKK